MERARTEDLEARAKQVLPGGNTHVARAYSPAVYVTRAQGSRKWLVDGRELIDYTMGHGALLLGHAHPAVVQAVRDQVARGSPSPASLSPRQVVTSRAGSTRWPFTREWASAASTKCDRRPTSSRSSYPDSPEHPSMKHVPRSDVSVSA